MSYQRISVITALLTTLGFPLVSQAAFWSPHVGADYKYWGLEPNEYYESLFPRINNTINFYVGTRINGYFGMDLGYEQSERREKGQTFIGDGTEEFFAQIEQPRDAATIDLRLSTVHFDLNFYWEVFRQFEVVFLAGVAFLHPSTHIFHLTDGTWLEYRDEVEMKTMGRVGIGVQYNILPCWGIKLLINWDPDIRINYNGFDQDDFSFDINPYKTSTSYNLGFVYSFSNPRRHRVKVYKDIYEMDP